MITADMARKNVAEYHKSVDQDIQSKAVAVCEEIVSPNIEDASKDGNDTVTVVLDNCSEAVVYRVVRIIREHRFDVRLDNDRKSVKAIW